jgi:hypothetical protein
VEDSGDKEKMEEGEVEEEEKKEKDKPKENGATEEKTADVRSPSFNYEHSALSLNLYTVAKERTSKKTQSDQ